MKTKSYDAVLDEQFKDIVIALVKHDTSPPGLPCYIEARLGKAPKDKGQVVLDLGNYIYRRFGIRYQMTPEYRGRGRATTLRWFMSWDDVRPILPLVKRALECRIEGDYMPFEFTSLSIQHAARGVYPKQQGVV